MQIITAPNLILTTPARPVRKINWRTRRLISGMVRTMYDNKAVGLAAPQVGEDLRLFVFDALRNGMWKVVINPVLMGESVEQEKGKEGCLSLPGVTVEVDRPKRIVIFAAWPAWQIEFSEFEARVVMHELDHLNGRLIKEEK